MCFVDVTSTTNTRDERLLIQAGVIVRYKMQEMNPEHSKQLFCWHAFHRQSCNSGFENLVDSFVEACGGLPLALQVMGAHVFGSDKGYWKLQLDDVKAGLHKDIKHRLKISYDALEDDEKQIFMDIACFFIGEEVSTAISIWKASGWRAEHALQTLKDKCLVEQEYYYFGLYVFRMHDHLRDLGREMADNEMNPCRLWRPKDLIGMHEIKELQDIPTGSEGKKFRCFNHISDNEDFFEMTFFLKNSKTSTDLQWLDLNLSSHPSYPLCIPQWIPLQNLKTLILRRASPPRLWQRDDQAPLKLKELQCFFVGPPIVEDVPLTDCCFEGPPLIVEDVLLTDCNELLSSIGMLKHLESLCLFGEQPVVVCLDGEPIKQWNIEWNCLLKSVRELTSLKTLELECFNIEGETALSNREETTDYQFCMRSLEAITLGDVLKTRRILISGQLCPTLKSLKLHDMEQLVEVDLIAVTTLECLDLSRCGKLSKVQLGNNLLELEMFRLENCRNMKELPNFGRVCCLKSIYICDCWNLQNISAIEGLKGLKRIWIEGCPKLQNIKATEQWKGLTRIRIQKCAKLQDIIGIKELKELKRIFIAHCPKLQNMEGIEELKGLKEMIISDSPIISCVQRLQRLPWELTILVGRPAMKVLNADKIGDTLSMADGFYEMECEQQVKEMIHSFHKTQHPLGAFIFCAMIEGHGLDIEICGEPRYEWIKGYADLRLDYGKWIYMCVVNEEMLTKYESWMPYYDKAFLMGVKKGAERKTLDILQRLLSQLWDGDCKGEYYERASDSDKYDMNEEYNAYSASGDYNGHQDYAEYDGGNDWGLNLRSLFEVVFN